MKKLQLKIFFMEGVDSVRVTHLEARDNTDNYFGRKSRSFKLAAVKVKLPVIGSQYPFSPLAIAHHEQESYAGPNWDYCCP